MSNELTGAQVDEIKELNNYARAIFGQFERGWAAFVAQNLIAGGLVAGSLLGDGYSYARVIIAMAVILLNALNSGYCLAVSCRLVMIDGRISELLSGEQSLLGNPFRTSLVLKEVWQRFRGEPQREMSRAMSPVPLRFYLTCIVPVALVGVPIATLAWIVGLFVELAR